MNMLRRIVLFLAAAVQLLAFSPDTPIAELKLNDGRVLHHVQIVGFSDHVLMAKWEGGRGTIRYESLPPELTHEIEPFVPKTRPYIPPPLIRPPSIKKPMENIGETSKDKITITGNAFAKGVDQPFIFADMKIGLYPRSAAENALNTEMDLPEPSASTRTNKDGEFKLEAIPGDYLLIARAERFYRGNSSTTIYQWKIPVSANSEITLSSDNADVKPKNTWAIRQLRLP